MSPRRSVVPRLVAAALAAVVVGRAQAAATLTIASIAASHHLPAKYAVDRAIDGDPKTHWAANSQMPQWVQIAFAKPQQVDTLRILGVSVQRIYDNWRRVRLTFSDGSGISVRLADTWHWHTITFPAREAGWVRLTIESTYKTTHYVGCEEIQALLAGHGEPACRVDPAPEAAADPAGAGWQPTTSDARLLARLAPADALRREHPNLWVDASDVERAKRHVRDKPWAFRYYRSVLQQADEWAARSADEIRGLVPKPYAVFDRSTTCPLCAARLTASFTRVAKGYCPRCKQAFPNDRYPDDGQGWQNPETGKMHHLVGVYNDMTISAFDRGLRNLADAYVLTGEEKFARTGSVLFDALAAIYPTCDKGPKTYPGVGGRLNRPFYQAARAMIGYTDAYDRLYHSPEWDEPSVDPEFATRRGHVEANFFGNGGEYCYTQILKARLKSLNNGYCDYLQGAVAVGRVLGIKRYLDYALGSEMSIFNFIENTIDRDGQYFETAFMYSSHAVELFAHHAEMLRNYRAPEYPKGVNLYDHPKLKLAFLRSESDVDCAGHVPPLGDTGPDLSVVRPGAKPRVNWYAHRRLEYLAARVGDPAERKRHAQRLRDDFGDVEDVRSRSSILRWLVFNAAPVPPARSVGAAKPVQTTLLPAGRGVGILRAGGASTGEVAALLRWGPTLNHGSPDELNLNFFALGREATLDPGYLWAHLRSSWTHATGAHNLVVVDEASQLQQAGSGGDLRLWCQTPRVRAVAADDPHCYGSRGVSQYRRTLVLADLHQQGHYLLDIFRVRGGATHDLNWHFAGDMTRVDGIELSPPQTEGSLAGPEYEWWKLMQPSGWLRGVDKGFYWIAPPGNGYGFIHELRRAAAPETCAFDWTLGQRAPEPQWPFEPAGHVAASSGKGHKALSLGAYFYRASDRGDYIEYELPVHEAGEYLVLAVFFQSSHYGIVQASLDGQAIGPAVNTYSPAGYFSDPVVLGRQRLTAGPHRLKFTVVGQDPESKGCYFSIRYFALDTPEFAQRAHQRESEAVRLTLLPPRQAEIIVGKSSPAGTWPGATYVITRSKGEDLRSQFVSLVEPFVAAAKVQSVERLQPAAGTDAPDLAALRITASTGEVHYVFEAPEPVESVGLTDGAGTDVRFAGRFAVALTRGGRVEQLALSGNGEVALLGKRLAVTDAEPTGKVLAVDVDACAVTIDGALPATGSWSGCVIHFTHASYSRRSTFTIRRVTPTPTGARIELDTSSLVMARGLVGAKPAEPGVIPNVVPLDRERMVKRGLPTLYFQGHRIAPDSGEDWGRVQAVSVSDWTVRSTEAVSAKPVERFSIVELAPGDAFQIARDTVRTFD